jgi:hypothetical protein
MASPSPVSCSTVGLIIKLSYCVGSVHSLKVLYQLQDEWSIRWALVPHPGEQQEGAPQQEGMQQQAPQETLEMDLEMAVAQEALLESCHRPGTASNKLMLPSAYASQPSLCLKP